jgi:hypothetical protein
MSNGTDKEQAELLKQIIELLKQQKTQTEEVTKSKEKSNEQLEKEYNWNKKSNDEKRREIQYNADLARMQGDKIEQQRQMHKAMKQLYVLEEEAVKISGEQGEAARAEAEAHKQLVKSIGRSMGMTDDYIDKMIENKQVIDDVTDSTLKYAKSSDNLFNSMRGHVAFLFGDKKTGLVGGMFEFAASMKQAEGGLGTFGNSFIKYFNLTSIATAMVNNFVQSTIGMVIAFENAAASFAAATGTGDEFTGTMLEMRQEGNALGVTFENSAKALQSLMERQVGFLSASKTAQKEMATQVALMERVGISTDTTAEMMNVFTINMGKSQGAAIQMTKSLVSMGGVLGNSQKFLQNFQESLKDLAVYGEGAVEVFSNMAAAARAAGIEVATLTGLAAKFDTFEDAANTVGRLNALLGSQMSSTEMLLMTEDQRIETLIQQVQISGESFAQMDRFKQKAIAAAAGISDMNEAQRIFGMNMKDYKKYQKEMERQTKLQENFNKAIEATIPFQEKLNQFMAEFAIAVKPIADFLGEIIGGLTSFMASLSEGEKVTLLLVSGIGLAITAFGGLSFAATAAGSAIGAGIGGGLATAGGAMTSLVASTGAATPVITAFGTAATGLTPILGALGTAATGAASGMGAFVLPLLGIALAVGGVALSIAAIVAAMGYLVSQFVELASAGPGAIGTITAFAGALTQLAAVGSIGLLGAGGVYASMYALTSGLEEIKGIVGNEASAISGVLGSLATIASKGAENAVSNTMESVTALASSLSQIKEVIGDENSAISNALENLALIATGTAARAAGGVTANIATELKGAVEALTTTKIDIKLSIDDGKLYQIMKEAVVDVVSNDGTVKTQIVNIARANK